MLRNTRNFMKILSKELTHSANSSPTLPIKRRISNAAFKPTLISGLFKPFTDDNRNGTYRSHTIALNLDYSSDTRYPYPTEKKIATMHNFFKSELSYLGINEEYQINLIKILAAHGMGLCVPNEGYSYESLSSEDTKRLWLLGSIELITKEAKILEIEDPAYSLLHKLPSLQKEVMLQAANSILSTNATTLTMRAYKKSMFIVFEEFQNKYKIFIDKENDLGPITMKPMP